MKKRALIISFCVAAAIIAVVLIVVNIVIPDGRYKKASSLFKSGEYTQAAEAFEALGDYKDSADQAKAARQEADYQAAQELFEKEEYARSAEAFTALGDYKDSKDRASDAMKKQEVLAARQNLEKYNSASDMAENGLYPDAYMVFEDLGDYNDSPERSEEMRTARFYEGRELFDEGKFDKAYDVFMEVSGWTFHKEYALIDEKEPEYWAAGCLFNMDRFEDAYNAFKKLGDYMDSPDEAQMCLDEQAYREALSMYKNKKYEDAKKAFDDLDEYKDSEFYSLLCTCHQIYDSLKDLVSQALERAGKALEGIIRELNG